MDVLTVCAGCSRHVKLHETLCPFCGAAMGERAMPMVDTDPGAARGLSRGRAFLAAAVTATASFSMAACYGDSPAPWYPSPLNDPSYLEPKTLCERVGDEVLCGLHPAPESESQARSYLGRIALMNENDQLRSVVAFAPPTTRREGGDFDGGVCRDPLAGREGESAVVGRVQAAAVSAALRACQHGQPWSGAQMIVDRATAEVCGAISVALEQGLLPPSRGVLCDAATGAPRQGYEGYGVVTAVYQASVVGPLQTPRPVAPYPGEHGSCPTAEGWSLLEVQAERGTYVARRRGGWSMVRLTPLTTVCAQLYPSAR